MVYSNAENSGLVTHFQTLTNAPIIVKHQKLALSWCFSSSLSLPHLSPHLLVLFPCPPTKCRHPNTLYITQGFPLNRPLIKSGKRFVDVRPNPQNTLPGVPLEESRVRGQPWSLTAPGGCRAWGHLYRLLDSLCVSPIGSWSRPPSPLLLSAQSVTMNSPSPPVNTSMMG